MDDKLPIDGALEWIPDAVLILGDGGWILFVNSAAGCLFGYSREELIGRSVDTCLPAMLCDRCLDLLDHTDEQEPRPIEVLELEGRRKDGSRFPVEIRGAEVPFRPHQALAARW